MFLAYKNALISLICVILYLINRFTKFYEVNEGLLKYVWDYNFTDCLCMILNLSLANMALAAINKSGIYSIIEICLLSLLSCFIWEVFIAWLKDGYTFDSLDCLAYFLGGLIYYFVLKRLAPRN